MVLKVDRLDRKAVVMVFYQQGVTGTQVVEEDLQYQADRSSIGKLVGRTIVRQ